METIAKNLETLAAFHSVAQQQSFTRAGEKLGLSKSMVSKQVKRLEALLSVQLLRRTTRSLTLTEEGKALFEYSSKIISLSSEAEKSLRELSLSEQGGIRISTPVGLGTTFFTSFLPLVAKELPGLQIHADISNKIQDIWADNIDFAIRASEDHHPNLIVRYLGQVRDVICITPKLAKSFDKNDPLCLEKTECILYEGENRWNTWTLTSGKEEVKIKAQGKYVTNTYQSALSFCLSGLGAARLPYYVAAEALEQGKLVQVFPKYEITTHPLYLVYSQNNYKTKKHKLAKQAILDWFAARPEFFVK